MDDVYGESLKTTTHTMVNTAMVSLLTLKITNGRMTFAAPIV